MSLANDKPECTATQTRLERMTDDYLAHLDRWLIGLSSPSTDLEKHRLLLINLHDYGKTLIQAYWISVRCGIFDAQQESLRQHVQSYGNAEE